jgi:hypothetical protein
MLLQSSSTCPDVTSLHGRATLIVSDEVVLHFIVVLILFSSFVIFVNYHYEKAAAKLGKIAGYVSMRNGL